MSAEGIHIDTLLQLGPIGITGTVVTSFGITALLGGLAWLSSRHLSEQPGRIQVLCEGIVEAIRDGVAGVAGPNTRIIMPFIGTLWVFIIVANLAGLVPGLDSPTRDLSATSALALLVFLSVHWFGIRTQGLRQHLRHYLSPTPILLPFHIISELTRTIALAVRLFGNMMSLEMAALLILMVAGLLAPVPILMLHIIEALVQAYIFGMLALIYIAGAIQSQQELNDDDDAV